MPGSLKMTREETLRQAIRAAARELANYAEPGPRDARRTVARLLEILDTQEVAAALTQRRKKPLARA